MLGDMNSNVIPNSAPQHHDGHDGHDDEHDLGLAYDLQRFAMSAPARLSQVAVPVLERPLQRRDFMRLALITGVAGGATLSGFRRSANAQTTSASCVDIPEETAGPYPGDGTNGPNVLTSTGVVRRDIRPSFGSMTGTAAGVPLTVSLTLTDSATCAPAKGYAVYLWHADQQGRYSLYSAGVTDQNYLRGVQEADANGVVTFQTVVPGCYDGRWPHIHFEVYPSLASAGDASKRIATSQLALPKATCEAAYVAPGYSASIPNLAKVSIATDGVFGDDAAARQIANVTGSVATGFTATLTVSVSNTVKASSGMGSGPGQPPAGGAGAPGAPMASTAPTTAATTTATTTTPATTVKKVATTVKKAVSSKKSTAKTTTTKKKTTSKK